MSLPGAHFTADPSDSASDWARGVWRSPLLPAAVVTSLGMVFDRWVSIPLGASLTLALLGILAWAFAHRRREHVALAFLALAGLAFGAARHHLAREVVSADDISHVAPAEPSPVHIRGAMEEEPFRMPAARNNPLRSQDREDLLLAILRVRSWRQGGSWHPVSGRVQLLLIGQPPELWVGDQVEVTGQLSRVITPGNPGERDQASQLRDQGIRTQLVVNLKSGRIVRLGNGTPASWRGWLALVRARGRQTLAEQLPPQTAALAAAVLLGDSSSLPAESWESYLRTGVIAVLVVSGQHLVMAALFLTLFLRCLGVRLRSRTAMVAIWAIGYAILTGGRPPAMRAGLMVLTAAGAVVLWRRCSMANLLAIAWLFLALTQPGDLFSVGCQLSFLAVALLCWLPRSWLTGSPGPTDPLDQLIEESRPSWQRGLLWLGRRAAGYYLATLTLWLALSPLSASRYHLISPAGLLLGPPLTLLTAAVLVVGFALLLLSLFLGPLVWPVALLLHALLAFSRQLVEWGAHWPGGHFYVSDIPTWWLLTFYLALLGFLTRGLGWGRWRWVTLFGTIWLTIGLLSASFHSTPRELRCTFLSVGHGSCIVLETPDGRVLLYDAGAIRGPQVTVQQIAPFLWSRGIRRIDEVFLSHADLDHFNGLVALLERFPVGLITTSTTFAEKDSPAVQYTLAVVHRRGIPMRAIHAGQLIEVGEVRMEVLHPPPSGLPGTENTRSLVLRVQYQGRSLLLTGDLEAEGLAQFLQLAPRRAEILMAPHHGSTRLDTEGLVSWASPSLIISCQGVRRSKALPAAYQVLPFLTTHEHGAITVCMRSEELRIETFRTGKTFHLSR